MQDNTLRVLHVIGGMDRGGAETMIMNLYRKIDRGKIQFDFLCMRKGKHHYDEEIKSLGGRIIYINSPQKVGIIKHIHEIISAICNNGPFAAVHAHTHFHTGIVSIAAFIAGVNKRICHSHSTSADIANIIFRKIYFSISRILIKMFATNMLACGYDAGIYLFGKHALESGKVIVLPNAIDLKEYEKLTEKDASQLKKILDLPQNSIIAGHVGRFSEPKNHKFFIPFLEYIKNNNINIYLLLVGDGELREDIQKLVDDKKLNGYVKMLGIREDIPDLMNMIDVFVMPSLYEGLPVTLVEAQAAGTPCVISDNITKEADMGLDLIDFVSLDSPLEIWIDKITEKAKNKLKDFKKIKEAYKERKYDIDETVKEIEKIYIR